MENQTINLTSEWVQGALGLIQQQLRIDELNEELTALQVINKANAKKLASEYNRLVEESKKVPPSA